jgi:hypothetical protein
MHAEVQKALPCAQLPTLDGSWRKKAVRVWHFFVFPQLISANFQFSVTFWCPSDRPTALRRLRKLPMSAFWR